MPNDGTPAFLFRMIYASSMSGEIKFCQHCGANLPDEALFCPECGYSREGAAPQAAPIVTPQAASNPLGSIPSLTLIYAIIAIILAVFLAIVGLATGSMVEIAEELYHAGTISEADYEEIKALFDEVSTTAMMAIYEVMALALAASGIVAYLAYKNSDQLIKWKTTFRLYLVASILSAVTVLLHPIIGIILCAVGLVITRQVYIHKKDFIS